MLLPDNNSKRITRLMLEKVNGKFQGACTHFLSSKKLRSGNHRLRFSPDGKQLYVGQTVRGWGSPAEGLQRITPLQNEEPFDISKFEITSDGFKLTFTADLAKPLEKKDLKFKSFTYQSRWTYGSAPEDKKDNPVKTLTQPDARTVAVSLDNFAAGRVYQLNLPRLSSTGKQEIQNTLFYYTANEIPR